MEDIDREEEGRRKKPTYDGACLSCGQTFSKARIASHLNACKLRQAASAKEAQTKGKPRPIMQLWIGQKRDPTYWLYVELVSESQFGAIDEFLRCIWLECCGHLSGFKFPRPKPKEPAALNLFATSGRAQMSATDLQSLLASAIGEIEEPGEEMDLTLASRVNKGDTFEYDYDYGSTTSLQLKVTSIRDGNLEKNDVELLARNLPPEIKCDCGQPAVLICPEHSWDTEGWLCKACAKKHSRGCDFSWDEMLPIVNSPRTGVCGYCGPAEWPPPPKKRRSSK